MLQRSGSTFLASQRASRPPGQRLWSFSGPTSCARFHELLRDLKVGGAIPYQSGASHATAVDSMAARFCVMCPPSAPLGTHDTRVPWQNSITFQQRWRGAEALGHAVHCRCVRCSALIWNSASHLQLSQQLIEASAGRGSAEAPESLAGRARSTLTGQESGPASLPHGDL